MENKFNEKESLILIQEMIENSKARLGKSSFFFLLWGWLVLLASLTHFILLVTGYSNPWLPWPVIMVIGGIAASVKGYRMKNEKRVKTYLDTTMIYLWAGFGISLFFVLFIAGTGKITWEMSNILIVALYGMGSFVSGGILKFRPLIIGGIFTWIIAIVSLFIAPEYSLLSVAVSIIVAYLIPGYMLQSKEKLQSHV
ncbi:MAG: hypothetical protein GXO86_07335 [Chlorobi bacterium]|nr:hypothetical protein [Chlorobiota bacterium]